jgi:hypothetical protein
MPTDEEQAILKRAVDECRAGNPRLFMESFLKIRDNEGTLVPMILLENQVYYNDETFATLYDYYEGFERLTVKHRDAFSTTYWHGAAFAFQYCVAGFVCASIIDSERKFKDVILPMMDTFAENIPAWMWTTPARGHWDTEMREIIHRGTDGSQLSSIMTFSSARTKNFARGGRPKMVIQSEKAAYEASYERELDVGLRGAIGETTWMVYESTPAGIGNGFHTKFKSIEAGTAPINAKILSRLWWDRRDHFLKPDSTSIRQVDAAEIRDTGSMVLTPEEMVLSSSFPDDGIPDLWRFLWRRWKVQGFTDDSRSDVERGKGIFLQEYPENLIDCWYNVANPSLPRERLRELSDQCSRPIEELFPEPGVKLQIWEKPATGRPYVMGFDPAEGVTGGDLLAAQVIDAMTGKHVAQMWGLANVTRFTGAVVRLGEEYNAALLIIERNGNGLAAILESQRLRYPNLYKPRPKMKQTIRGEIAIEENSKKTGVWSDPSTRSIAHDAAWNGLYDGSLVTPSTLLVQDMLEYNPDADHVPDRFSAFMWAAYALRERGAQIQATGRRSRGSGPEIVETVSYV